MLQSEIEQIELEALYGSPQPRRRCRAVAPDDGGDLLTPEQLAGRLHVPVGWVHEQTRGRACKRSSDPLPFIHLGHYLRFSWTEVMAWMNRHTIKGKERGR